MKKIFSFFAVMSMVFLTTCTTVVASGPSLHENSHLINSMSATSSQIFDIPSFPNLTKVDDEYYTHGDYFKNIEGAEIPMDYEFTNISDRFLSLLNEMNEKDFTALLDLENFFPIGDAVLFSISLSPCGPSKIYIDYVDGTIEEVFSCMRPIEYMRFKPNSRNLTICTANYIIISAIGKLEHYEINFEEASVDYVGFDVARGDIGYYNMLYHGELYVMDPEREIGAAYTLYRESRQGQFTEIIKSEISGFAQIEFAQGRIFFYENNDNILYSCDLMGKDRQVVCETSSPIQYFKIIGEHGIVVGTQEEGVVLYQEDQMIALNDDVNSSYSWYLKMGYSDEGFYLANWSNGTMVLMDWQGNAKTVFSEINWQNMGWINVVENWAYFSYNDRDGGRGWLHGKVQLDGTDLSFFS